MTTGDDFVIVNIDDAVADYGEYDLDTIREVNPQWYNLLKPIYDFLINGSIHDPHYLLERKWFFDTPNLFEKLCRIITQNKGHYVNVYHGDFEEHLDGILDDDHYNENAILNV